MLWKCPGRRLAALTLDLIKHSGPKSRSGPVDQSKFCISFGNQGPRVWRKNGEAHNPRCLKSSVKFPQSVLVWGAMSSAGVGPLCCPQRRTCSEHFMLPSADKLYGDADFIFQQDLGPAHTAKNKTKTGSMTMGLLCLIYGQLWA